MNIRSVIHDIQLFKEEAYRRDLYIRSDDVFTAQSDETGEGLNQPIFKSSDNFLFKTPPRVDDILIVQFTSLFW